MWATSAPKAIEKKSKAILPLEKYTANARQSFAEKRAEVPKLRATAKDIRKKCNQMQQRYHKRMRADLLRKADEIDAEADIRESMSREHAYEQMIAPYLKAYNQRVEIQEPKDVPRNITAPGCGKQRETIDNYIQQHDATASRQNKVINEYLMETTNDVPKLALHTRDECPICNADLMLMNTKSIMTCQKCGYSVTYLDATMSCHTQMMLNLAHFHTNVLITSTNGYNKFKQKKILKFQKKL